MEPKERMLIKAHELFMQYGIRSVSMDDISNSLGMSKKTLYQYFSDKDELYRSEINTDVMSKFRLESMMIPFNISIFPPGKYNLADISSQVIEHFVYGLVTIKGHKLILKYKQARPDEPFGREKKLHTHESKLAL